MRLVLAALLLLLPARTAAADGVMLVGQWVALPGLEEHPAVEVSWFGARDYCAWKGKRLPTEAECATSEDLGGR